MKKGYIRAERVTTWQKICYAMGDFAQNGTFQFVAYYLLYFYTDEAECSLQVINVVLILGRVVDAIVTPLVGTLVDCWHFKWGKCKPFLLMGSICLNIALPLLFFVPAVSVANVRKWLIIIYIFYSFSYALANVPYSVLMSVMTDEEEERYSLNCYKNVGANIGGALVSVSTLPLVGWFAARQSEGYFSTAIFYAGLFFICSVFCICFTKEKVFTKKAMQEKGVVSEKKSISWLTIRHVFSNKPWVMFLCIQFLGCLQNMLHAQSLIYYCKYCLGNENVSSIFMVMGPVTAVLAAFYLQPLAKRIGKRNCVVLGCILMLGSLLGICFSEKNLFFSIGMQLVYSFGWATSTGLIFVIINATIDYQDRMTNERPQGFMVSFMSFLMKCGSLAGVFLGTKILSSANYQAGVKATERVLRAIRAEFIWVPLLLCLPALLLAVNLKLDEGICFENKK